MKLPVLKEIQLPSFKNTEVIQNILLKEKAGDHPCYFIIPETFNLEQISQLLALLEEIFHELRIHPILPYPFYVITKKVNHHPFFPILTHPNKITSYYSPRTSKFIPMENTSLEKIGLHLEKAKYSQIAHKMFFLRDGAQEKKRLYQLAHENSYYAKIIASFPPEKAEEAEDENKKSRQ